MTRWLFALPLLLFAGLAIAFGAGLGHDPKVLPSQLINRPLPAFRLASVLADAPGIDSAQLKGEPALLNVFASWCAACPQEHPMLTRIAGEGVAVYGLNWKDQPDDARAWLDKLGNPYRRIASDPTGRAGVDLGVTGVPETFVVDRRGRVRYKHTGPITPEDWEAKLKPLLDQLRTERA